MLQTRAGSSPEEPWFGQMSLPRELSLKDGRLYQGPVREFDSMRRIKHQRRSLVNTADGELKLRIILDRFSVEVFVNDCLGI